MGLVNSLGGDVFRTGGDNGLRDTNWVSGGGTEGGDGASGGRESLEFLDAPPEEFDNFGEVPAFDTNSACGTGLARGFGDWILVAAVRVAGTSSSESESEDSDDEDVDTSLSSRNSNTFGTFFACSADCGDDSEAACDFTTFLEPLFWAEEA